MLDRVFVRTADFEALAAGPNHNFVIGRRGAGKSALFIELTKEFTKRGELLISFVPEESTVKGLVAALRERLPSEPKYTNVRSLMRVVWRAALLAVVGRTLGRKDSSATSFEKSTELPWLASDLLASALAVVEALPSGSDPDALVYKAASFTGLDKLTDLVRTDLDALGSRVVILIDKLDEGWRPHDIEAGIVGGLCSAVIDLRDKRTNVHGVIFLRDNVFRLLEDIDDDFSRNMAGDNLRLRWDEQTLLDLVARRIEAVTGIVESTPLKTWNRFAKQGLEGKEGFQFCLQKTLYRPRDILELLNTARHLAALRRRSNLIKEDINDAARDIAQIRLGDLYKEYEEVFAGLTSYVRAFSGRPAIDTLKNVLLLIEENRPILPEAAQKSYSKLGSASAVVLALFGVGFLGFALTGMGFQFCHDGADRAPADLPPETKVAVHPCYSRALDIIGADDVQFDVLLAVNDDYDEEKPDKQSLSALFKAGANTLLTEISGIQLGEADASKFEDWVLQALRLLLSGELSNIEKKPNKDAPKRRDIVGSNEAKSGVWKRLLQQRNAGQIIFEVKNFEDLGADAYHQTISYATGVYGNVVFLVHRGQRSGLNDNERSWVQQSALDGKLLVLVPVVVLIRCLQKQLGSDRADYTKKAIARWIDTHERNYVNPRSGRRGS